MKNSILLFFLLFSTSQLYAQKYLTVDKYKMKRVKFEEGDPIRFKIKGQEQIFTDHIRQLNDTSLVLASNQLELPLSEFEQLHVRRKWVPVVRYGSLIFGGGFLMSAAVYPLVSNPRYDYKLNLILGGSFIALNQVVRVFTWKKYKFEKNARIQIIDTSIR